jgi:hypothetical protein
VELLATPIRRRIDPARLPKRPFECACHLPPARFKTLDELVAHRGD